MSDIDTLIESYIGQKEEIDTLTAKVKETQVQMRETLKEIVDSEGKGPFKFGDRNCRIVDRKGLLCLMPSDRPKVSGTRKAKAPKAAKEPKAASAKSTVKKRAKKPAEDAVAAE